MKFVLTGFTLLLLSALSYGQVSVQEQERIRKEALNQKTKLEATRMSKRLIEKYLPMILDEYPEIEDNEFLRAEETRRDMTSFPIHLDIYFVGKRHNCYIEMLNYNSLDGYENSAYVYCYKKGAEEIFGGDELSNILNDWRRN